MNAKSDQDRAMAWLPDRDQILPHYSILVNVCGALSYRHHYLACA
ncbi:hypothetical protein [Rugosimonospora africana]|nr:hypothetical protein [Rugosimonospora africana]